MVDLYGKCREIYQSHVWYGIGYHGTSPVSLYRLIDPIKINHPWIGKGLPFVPGIRNSWIVSRNLTIPPMDSTKIHLPVFFFCLQKMPQKWRKSNFRDIWGCECLRFRAVTYRFVIQLSSNASNAATKTIKTSRVFH